MDGFLTFISLVVFVFGILQIILFFKLWGMTNDIRTIRKHLVPEQKTEDKYYINVGEQVRYEGKTYEVVENFGMGICKCKDIETGRFYSLQRSDLEIVK